MKRYLSGVAVAVAALVTIGIGTAMAQPGSRTPALGAAPRHDRQGHRQRRTTGFGIQHYDGTRALPADRLRGPGRVRRVRHPGRAGALPHRGPTWYRDLADLKNALEWANRRR